MKIQSSHVDFSASHRWQRSSQQVTVVLENGRPVEGRQPPRPQVAPPQPAAPAAPEAAPAERASDLRKLDADTNLLKALVEAMTGRRIEQADIDTSAPARQPETAHSGGSEPSSQPERREVSVSRLREYEFSDVQIRATVQTASGEQIDLNLSLTLERRYQETTLDALIRTGKVTDPLVINFDGLGARLQSARTDFDLDADGSADSIARLQPGSAWLALDRNGDGTVNDGSELFGPATGDGFAELAAYDQDNNGFIDTNDSVYTELRVFRPGDGFLATLSELEIGALYTGAVESPFTLTDSNNRTLGQVRATGLYLAADGAAGVLQQVDLSV